MTLDDWMRSRGYREQTIDTTVKEARQVVAWTREGRPLPPRLRRSALRTLEYLRRAGEAAEPALLDVQPELERLAAEPAPRLEDGRFRGRAKRKKLAQSIADADWQALAERVEADASPAGLVLGVLVATGLRNGDVLRLERRSLEEAARSGRLRLEVKGGDDRLLPLDGAPEPWARLIEAVSEAKARTVALLVAPRSDGDTSASGGAYKAVERRLHALAEEAGVEGRVYLHRLRRTVGVQALRLTEDTVAVQQLLGHRSHATTLGYLDEARPDRVAELQRQVRERFSK